MVGQLKPVSWLTKRSSTLIVVAGFLLVIPALALLYYIHIFGVNVISWDEWTLVGHLRDITNGTGTWSDLWIQHNEHRLFFPFLFMLLLAKFTRYNTVAEMFSSWVFLCLTGALIYLIFRRKLQHWNYFSLLLFLPVSLLLFNFRQYESILWGFECQIYMSIFGVVAAFYLLDAAGGLRSLPLACLSGILASYSFATGLSVWPVGLLQLLLSEKKIDWRKIAVWMLVGTSITSLYFYGWFHPSGHPPLGYVLANPVEGAEYFAAYLLSPFLYLSYAPLTAISGLAILAGLLVVALIQVRKRGLRLLRANRFFVSLFLFGVSSALITTIGRSGFGLGQAFSSRYAALASIGVIGLYLLALSRWDTKRVRACGLLVLMVIGMVAPYYGGWQAAQASHLAFTFQAYVLKTYTMQSDENLGALFPSPALVKDRARFVEQERLNVFSEPAFNTSTLAQVPGDTAFALDPINGKQASIVVINSTNQETITITGWAIDRQAKSAAFTVFVNVDGRIDIPTLYGLDRPDAVAASKDPNFRFSGYIASFSSSYLSPGQHTIRLKIVTQDRGHFYLTAELVSLIIY
jgi:hypothetical protein